MSATEQRIRELLEQSGTKVIVLDDDPTGMQTVHGIQLLTSWEDEALTEAFRDPRPLFYILTNTRSYDEPTAGSLIRTICKQLLAISQREGIPFVAVSRGDSTLRGHYPLEIEIMAEVLGQGQPYDGHILAPVFFEGGRITKEDIHYLLEGGQYVPVGETEFARDAAFGFSSSNLRDWVEEKTRGRTKADQVVSITLDDIRKEGADGVRRKLIQVTGNTPVVVNAESYDDLEVAIHGVMLAEAEGKRFLYRSGASLVKVRAAVATRPLLTAREMVNADAAANGGVIFVGSHVKKTTAQLQYLLEQHPSVEKIELNVRAILDPERRDQEVERASVALNGAIRRGSHSVVYTSRELVLAEGAGANLNISQHVSSAMIDVVRSIKTKPRFVIAKGGITSNDIASRGLGIRCAEVLGQAEKGIPVWQCGVESRFPGMPYIVFPGNVGNAETLGDLAGTLMTMDQERSMQS